jgi:septal ring factor EnvC (AmiA/AmiB activator)
MSDSQLVSVAEAAKLVGRNRQTLYRDYLKTGKLSCIQDPVTRKKLIAISELIRVFGAFSGVESGVAVVSDTVALGDNTRQHETGDDTAKLQAKLAALQAENQGLRDRLGDKEAHIEDLRATVRLLEFKQPAKKAWWSFGKG